MRSLLCLLLYFMALAWSEKPFYQAELIFPPEKWHNHGSSIVELPDGGFLTCWFHGSGERKADDVVVLGAHRSLKNKQWSKPFVMADTPGFPDCNPVLWVDPQKRLWLFWIVIVANEWQSCILKYRTAIDYSTFGKAPKWNWQDNIIMKPKNFTEALKAKWPLFLKEFPQQIPDLNKKTFPELTADEEIYHYVEKKGHDKLQQRLGWMTRIQPIVLKSGRWLLPLYTDAYSVSLIAISSDQGKTWQASSPLLGFGNIQPSLVERKDGSVVAFMRENGPRYRIRFCESHDEGMTWGDVTNLNLPNPGSSVDCIALKSGSWALVYNDTIDKRHQLKVSLSPDEGKTWRWHRYLEKVPKREGSFSYPSLIQSQNGEIHLTYSYKSKGGKSIKHVAFNEAWIREN